MNGASAGLGRRSGELRDDVDSGRFELVRDGEAVAWMKYKDLIDTTHPGYPNRAAAERGDGPAME